MPTAEQIRWALELEGEPGLYWRKDRVVYLIRNQEDADKIDPQLFGFEAQARIVKISPMLGPIRPTLMPGLASEMSAEALECGADYERSIIDTLIVCGGSEPVHPDWIRSLRDQCAAAGVRFVFQGWGEWVPVDHPRGCFVKHLAMWNGESFKKIVCDATNGAQHMHYVGAANSGRTLDGKTHDWETPTGGKKI